MEGLAKWIYRGDWDSINGLLHSPLTRWSLLTATLVVVNQILVTALADVLLGLPYGLSSVAPEHRQGARLSAQRRGTALTRALLAAISAAYFFIATGMDYSWYDVLYRNTGVATPAMIKWMPLYCEFQAARFVFTAFVTPDLGFGWIVASVIRGTHIIICLMLIVIQSAGGSSPSLVYLIFLCHMDALDVLDNFKLSTTLPPLQSVISWRLVSTVWFVFRLVVPVYAIYAGSLGMFAGRVAFSSVIMFQLIVWLQLPSDPVYLGGDARNAYQRRVEQQQQQQQSYVY